MQYESKSFNCTVSIFLKTGKIKYGEDIIFIYLIKKTQFQ